MKHVKVSRLERQYCIHRAVIEENRASTPPPGNKVVNCCKTTKADARKYREMPRWKEWKISGRSRYGRLPGSAGNAATNGEMPFQGHRALDTRIQILAKQNKPKNCVYRLFKQIANHANKTKSTHTQTAHTSYSCWAHSGQKRRSIADVGVWVTCCPCHAHVTYSFTFQIAFSFFRLSSEMSLKESAGNKERPIPLDTGDR